VGIKNVVVATAVASMFLMGTHSALGADETGTEGKVKCEGVNSCKGTSDCHSARNACKGQNGCAGQGYKFMSQAECDAAKAKLKEKKS
jgi:hypothetical protein